MSRCVFFAASSVAAIGVVALVALLALLAAPAAATPESPPRDSGRWRGARVSRVVGALVLTTTARKSSRRGDMRALPAVVSRITLIAEAAAPQTARELQRAQA